MTSENIFINKIKNLEFSKKSICYVHNNPKHIDLNELKNL